MNPAILLSRALCLLVLLPVGVAAQPAVKTQPLTPRSQAPASAKPFQLLPAAETGATLTNVFDDPRMWGERFRELTLGAVETGIAVLDFNRDGALDLYVVSKNGPCALYQQVAPFKFIDVAPNLGVDCVAQDAKAGKAGATVVDINQDGWPDLYVCRYDAPNLLFVSDGDGGFTEQAQAYGLAVKDASVHAGFADYDRDGDLDCYLVTNILDFSKSPQGRRDFLFRNNGDGTFTDVSQAAGIWGLTQGHSALWFDANQDGWPDLYVANDFETPDRFYLNRGDGTFTDVVDERLPHVTYFSMGADAGDIDGDGRIDFLVADMRDRSRREFMTGMEEVGRGLWELERVTALIPQYMWNAVYLHSGTDRYLEAAHLLGLQATGWTWAARLADLDSDGRVDAFFTAGMIRNFIDADLVDRQNVAPTLAARAAVWKNAPPRRESTLAYRNAGDLGFVDVSREWGLDEEGVSFGCALADLDGDGDLDLVYARYDAPVGIVRNDSAGGHRVAIKLAGHAPNRDAIGAELRLETAAGGGQLRQVFTERGIVASEPPVVHFGLGDQTTITRLTIRWPRGQVQVLENLPADKLLTISEPPLPAEATLAPAVFHAPALPGVRFTEQAAARGLDHVSSLRPFDEFARQRLLPRRLHGQGPALAVADVDGDGREDVFVSGASGNAGQLFLGRADGGFVSAPLQPWAEFAAADEVGAVFFDANGDRHPDLLIASGGVERAPGDALLDNRLYLNDGRGNFVLAAPDVLPRDGASDGALVAGDYDGDGAQDLFLGARVVAGNWPATPRSTLFRNVGGRFVDVTDEVAPALRSLGLVTAARWADLDADGRLDLVLALEWGAVTWLRNTGTGFEDATARAGLAPLTGWWSALAIADLDGDGRLDVVAGNVGLNTKYRAALDAPTLLYAGDLDGSGREQLLEACSEDGGIYPLRGRSKLAYAFPALPRRFPTFKAFAAAQVSDLFPAERLARVTRLAATELASGVFFQRSPGQLTFVRLPRAAQLAPICAVVTADVDRDGHLDLVIAGNNFGPEPSTGRFDGGLGLVLHGDGRGGFRALAPAESGFVVPGEARALALLAATTDRSAPRVLVTRTAGAVLLFQAR